MVPSENADESAPVERKNFLEKIIEEELAAGKNDGRVVTRFPPEPNGFLHIGHAKAICINFGLAQKYGGVCNLRFDDTNPAKEETRFVEAIKEDIRWLGFDWEDRLYFASDYFPVLQAWAHSLITKGLAYVCDLTAEEMREYRGSLTEPGRESPNRDRSVEENLLLFAEMSQGKFDEGSRTLRAKIDMSSPNVNLRDPVMYRIMKKPHHRVGHASCIYPTYDWAHGQSDWKEQVTHSLCSLEFENHRPLYDWFLDSLSGSNPSQDSEAVILQAFEEKTTTPQRVRDLPDRPRQIEFARLELTHTLTSKRKLRQLVEDGHVDGWDDPRMPTLSGIRRRGVPAEAIRMFCDDIGVAKYNSTIEMVKFENAVREVLNRKAERRMAVLDPIKVVITNYPEGQVEELEAVNNPEDPDAGMRKMPFSREVWIEREDFREEAPRKFFRLVTGREVRLRYAYVIRCDEVIKDDAGEIVELRCTYDPESGGGKTSDGRKVKGIIHWVSAAHGHQSDVTVYDHLFASVDPSEGEDFLAHLNPESRVVKHAILEPSLKEAAPGQVVQFERVGYFCNDAERAKDGEPSFHRTVGLRDTWAKVAKKG